MHLSFKGNEMKQLSLNKKLFDIDTSLLNNETLLVSNLLALLLICL